jgi:hypothetical protein
MEVEFEWKVIEKTTQILKPFFIKSFIYFATSVLTMIIDKPSLLIRCNNPSCQLIMSHD